MTLSPKLGVVETSTLWHFRLPLLIQMFIKVASSPRLSGIGMPSPILWSHLLNMQRIVLLSSLLWWELGTNSLITGPGEWLSLRRFTSKLSWSWSWTFRYRNYFPRKLQIRQTNECAARVCLSDLQVSREIFPVSESQCGLINIYWPKVLTDQSGWTRFFRRLEILRKLKRTNLKQVIIHLSKLLKFIFEKSHYVTFFASDWKVPYQNMRLQFSALLITHCIGLS